MGITRKTLAAACLLAAVMNSPAARGDAVANTLPSSATPSPLQLEWDARMRQEQVDDDGFGRDASATTLRLRLGLRGQFGHGWSGLLEGAGVAAAGDRYNSGANGHTQYPGITDPRGSQLNQAWLGWHDDVFAATAGRQRLLLDNQRWIGNSGWRQFEQTFDGVALQWRPAADWTLQYDWLDRVHRVAGPDATSALARSRRLDTHLLHATYVRGMQQWTGYAYLHEDRDLPTASTATYGARWTGLPVPGEGGFGWTLEAARQVDYANDPQHFAHAYWLLEPAWTAHGITAKAGWEHLAGDGRHALQTPLATLHVFNGWDDQFNVTPPGGLDDRYLALNGSFGGKRLPAGLGWVVSYHDYHADHGGRYGNEWDASLSLPLAPSLTGLLKVADYHADGYGHDDKKLWVQLEWHGQQALRR
jgi:hypothetical protein